MSTSLFDQYKAALRRGHMAALAGDLEEALAAYDEAARLVPERALPLASRGTVLHRLDRWPAAAEAFDRALQLAPDDEAALRARAIAREERGIRSGAAADFEKLAFVLDVAGRSVDAADAARRAADLEPSSSRAALADRLGAAAAHLADLTWGRGAQSPAAGEPEADEPEAVDPEGAEPAAAPDDAAATEPDDAAATEPTELAEAWAAMAERVNVVPAVSGPDAAPEAHVDLGAFDALEALRVGMAAEERTPAGDTGTAHGAAEATDAAPEAETVAHAPAEAIGPQDGGNGAEQAADGDGAWPRIDLPSPPPAPIEGPPPDPEDLLADAALVLESGEVEAARDLMLTAIQVHREAGRTDAALDIALNLLSIAPGDARVHLSIANLQLDRGWTGVATEKIDLLVRLTSLTGDTQAEADVHGLASERLRDDPAAATAPR